MMMQTHLLDWPTRIVAAAVFKILPTNFSLFFFLKNTKEQKEKVPHTTFTGMKFIKHFFLTSTLFIPCCCCSVGQTWHPYRDPPLVTKEQKSTNNNILFGVFDAVLQYVVDLVLIWSEKKRDPSFRLVVTSNRRAKRPSTSCYHVGRA